MSANGLPSHSLSRTAADAYAQAAAAADVAAPRGPNLLPPPPDGLNIRADTGTQAPIRPRAAETLPGVTAAVPIEVIQPPASCFNGTAAALTFAGVTLTTISIGLNGVAASLGRAQEVELTAGFTAFSAAAAAAAATQAFPNGLGSAVRSAISRLPNLRVDSVMAARLLSNSVDTVTALVDLIIQALIDNTILRQPQRFDVAQNRPTLNGQHTRIPHEVNLNSILTRYAGSNTTLFESIDASQRALVQAALELPGASGNGGRQAQILAAYGLVEGWADAGLISDGARFAMGEILMGINNSRPSDSTANNIPPANAPSVFDPV
jgi:hypothetical protein